MRSSSAGTLGFMPLSHAIGFYGVFLVTLAMNGAIDAFWRTVGKIGIDATAKSANAEDFERVWPANWGKVKLEDYL
ncbi:MAG: hypothetical protein VB959_11205 [Rhodospirillales bacterium]